MRSNGTTPKPYLTNFQRPKSSASLSYDQHCEYPPCITINNTPILLLYHHLPVSLPANTTPGLPSYPRPSHTGTTRHPTHNHSTLRPVHLPTLNTPISYLYHNDPTSRTVHLPILTTPESSHRNNQIQTSPQAQLTRNHGRKG